MRRSAVAHYPCSTPNARRDGRQQSPASANVILLSHPVVNFAQ
jgi:hypothetical protein